MEKARKYGANFRREVTALGFGIRVVITLLAMQVLYSNLVHEPLHLLALNIFGQQGTIVFDWILPATPVVNYVFAGVAVWQALIVFLLPSAINILLIALLGSIRTRFPTIKIGAIAYLAFDIILNIRGFQSPTSDFRWLQAVNHSAIWQSFMIILVIALALVGIYRGVQRVKIVKVIKKDSQTNTHEPTHNNGEHGSSSLSRGNRATHAKASVD